MMNNLSEKKSRKEERTWTIVKKRPTEDERKVIITGNGEWKDTYLCKEKKDANTVVEQTSNDYDYEDHFAWIRSWKQGPLASCRPK